MKDRRFFARYSQYWDGWFVYEQVSGGFAAQVAGGPYLNKGQADKAADAITESYKAEKEEANARQCD